jgi:hypothetical protein
VKRLVFREPRGRSDRQMHMYNDGTLGRRRSEGTVYGYKFTIG